MDAFNAYPAKYTHNVRMVPYVQLDWCFNPTDINFTNDEYVPIMYFVNKKFFDYVSNYLLINFFIYLAVRNHYWFLHNILRNKKHDKIKKL